MLYLNLSWYASSNPPPLQFQLRNLRTKRPGRMKAIKNITVLLYFFFFISLPSSYAAENFNAENSHRVIIQGEFSGFKFATLSSCADEWDEAWCVDAVPKSWTSEEITLITKALKDLEGHHQLSHFLNAIKQSRYNTFYRYNRAPENPSMAASASASANVKSIDFYNRLFYHWMKQVDPNEYYQEIIKGTLVHEMTHVLDTLDQQSQIRKYSHAPQFIKYSKWEFNSTADQWQYGNVSPFIIQSTFSYFLNLVGQQRYQFYKGESDKWNKTYKAVSLYSTINRKESLAEMAKGIVLKKKHTKHIIGPQLLQWIEQKVLLIQQKK